MNEDVFNASLRGFLKKVGITSQREIEKAVRDAIEAGKLKGNEKLPAKMVLTIGGVSLSHEISTTRSNWASTHNRHHPPTGRANARPMTGSGGRSSIPEKSAFILIGRGVLDAPPQCAIAHKAGHDDFFCRKHHMDIKVRDSNGAQLAEGDTVTLIKDLKLKGSSTVLKRGTVIRNIHLTDDPDEIEGRTDKVKGLVLRTEFLKKA